MPNRTLSVRVEDQPIWERAEQRAKTERTSLSAFVTVALANHLAYTPHITITVTAWKDNKVRPIQFTGRWLIAPGEYSVGSTTCSIAETAKGRIAVWHNYGRDVYGALDDYDTLEQARVALPWVERQQWAKVALALESPVTADI